MKNPASGGSYVRSKSGPPQRQGGTEPHKEGDRARTASGARINRPTPPVAEAKPASPAAGAKPDKTED